MVSRLGSSWSNMTSLAWYIYSWVILIISGGIVAENKHVCLSLFTWDKMNLMSSILTMSSILSASSRTKYFISFSLIVRRFIWSVNLPEVATTTWIPLLS